MAEGLGGLVYVLSCIGDWWQDSTLLDDAELLARSFALDPVESDRQLDVIGGSAGAILGLLKLYRLRASRETLALARACADRLCRVQHTEGEYSGAWDSAAASRPLTGFSHGASGIACALANLHTVTREPRLLAAAHAAIEFERAAFVPAAGNWIDFRQPAAGTAPLCATSWCHGAPGIALARLALLGEVPTSALAADLETALQTTRQACSQTADHVCCGNFGRFDILLHASTVLDRSDLAMGVSDLAWRARRPAGTFRTFPTDVPEVAKPGFFDGLAGIGYVLLRLGAPQELPCVLAFE
jgi:lantibiotic modifying enzyme